MASRPDYDFVLQLSWDVLRDVQTRVINASLLTNLALTSPISRVLAQTVSPFQMKAHWAKPGLEIAEDVVTLSADVQGGARYAIEGINLTMEGPASSKCRPTVLVNDVGQPVVALVPPSPLDLNLSDLKLTYEGDDEHLTPVDAAIQRTLLRPTLCTQLMAPLANLPLNCLPDTLPLRLTDEPDHLTPSTDSLALADAAISLDPQAESLTLAMRCVPHTTTPAPPSNLLSERSTANAAVALSEMGLNRILGWLCAQGLATGTTPQHGGPVSWRWTHVVATFTDRAIHVTGQLWQGETATVIDAELQCSLSSSVQVAVHLIAGEPQPAGADVLIDAWAHLLRRTFYAATRPPGPAHPTGAEPDSAPPLLQRFVIPGTGLSTEGPMVDLRLRHGYLVALYAVPPDEQPFTLTLEEKKPEPTIIQPVVPIQDATGTPVTIQLAATLADSPQPPYDYAWRTDQEYHPRQHHSPTITVTKTPPPTMSTGEPQKLATVKLKVIDILGKAGEAEVDAMYHPAAQHQEKHQDGNKETTAALGGAGIIASAAQLYQKWKDRHKEAAAALRVVGPAVAAAIVVAILVLMALPGDVTSNEVLPQPSQGPLASTSAESPSSSDPAPPPGGSTTSRQTYTNGPAGPPPPTNRGGAGSGGGGGAGSGGGGTGGGGTGSVQIRTDGTGTVTSQPGGISCPPTCSADFPTGTAVQLTAAPSTTAVFGSWSGSCTGTNITCQVTIPDAGADITATFIPKPQLTVLVSDGGSVTGSGISCPPTCSAMVNPGESVTLTAQADSYYNFGLWGGDSPDTCTATTPTCTVVMNGDKTLSAKFNSEIAPFIGTWRNVDPNTPSIPQVMLTETSPSTATLQVWGSCTPTWCDWGTTTATLSDGGLEAFYDQGFATRTIFISQSNGQLIVQIHTHFTDNSGRQDYDSTDIMDKA